jgi:DNA-binding NarL/FixJ family response regulator
MDVGMPLLNGIEATRRICEQQLAGHVVVLTGREFAEDAQRAQEAGAAAHVRKVHAVSTLAASIKALV